MPRVLRMRRKILINTDPQRRCYYGAHAKYELVWSDWEILDSNVKPDKVDSTLEFWRSLNEYAVSQRGEEAVREFEIIDTGEEDA